MKRYKFKLFLAGAATLFAICASGTPALAQGSTGGTIGKQGKSVSGDLESQTPGRSNRGRGSAKSGAESSSASLTAASLRGHWVVKTTCTSGADSLSFDIRNSSPTDFTGDYEPGGGKILEGTITGNRVRIVTKSIFTVTWTATVTGGGGKLRMDGGYTPGPSLGDCKFTATKS